MTVVDFRPCNEERACEFARVDAILSKKIAGMACQKSFIVSPVIVSMTDEFAHLNREAGRKKIEDENLVIVL